MAMDQNNLWTGFQMPRRLAADTETLTERYGRFSAQPFERGFGTTVGNSLRRALLSSIEGAAITAVKKAVKTVLRPTGWSEIDWEFPPADDDGQSHGRGHISVKHEKGVKLPLAQLSDGLVVLTSDLRIPGRLRVETLLDQFTPAARE